MCPKTKGELLTFAKLHREGHQTLANPQQTGVGKNLGVQGGEAPMTGAWGVSPRKTKIKGQ